MIKGIPKQTNKKNTSVYVMLYVLIILSSYSTLFLISLLCADLTIISPSPNWNWIFEASLSDQRDLNTFPCEWRVNTSCSVKPLSLCVQITLRQNGFFTAHLIVGRPYWTQGLKGVIGHLNKPFKCSLGLCV